MSVTKELIDKMNRQDEWGSIREDVPIFVEHSMYFLPNGHKHAVVKGKSAPENSKLWYEVGPERLSKIADNWNRNFYLDSPVRIFLGHTNEPNSKAVGWQGPAKVADWNGIKAIVSNQYIEKEHLEDVKDYTQRSPEFIWQVDELPAVALLPSKSVPRLAMGNVSYASEDVECVYYGGMPVDGTVSDMISDPADGADATKFTGEEKMQAQRIYEALLQVAPEIQFLSALYKSASDANSAPLPSSPGAATPAGVPGAPSSSHPPLNYEMEIQTLKRQLADAEIRHSQMKAEIEGLKAPVGVDLLKTQHYQADDHDKAEGVRFRDIESVMYQNNWSFDNAEQYDEAVRIASEKRAERKNKSSTTVK